MPIWLCEIRPLYAGLVLVVFIEMISMVGLLLTRRVIIPRLHYHDGANDAVSGTVQAIGVFYGITVGLIAVGVWNTNSSASDLVSREASAVGGMYRDVAGLPSPLREDLLQKLREYTEFVIYQDWPAQQNGKMLDGGTQILNDFQLKLFGFQPGNPSE